MKSLTAQLVTAVNEMRGDLKALKKEVNELKERQGEAFTPHMKVLTGRTRGSSRIERRGAGGKQKQAFLAVDAITTTELPTQSARKAAIRKALGWENEEDEQKFTLFFKLHAVEVRAKKKQTPAHPIPSHASCRLPSTSAIAKVTR